MPKKKAKKKNKIRHLKKSYMVSEKDQLKNIIKDETNIDVISDVVERTNKIVIHTYQFLKMFLLWIYEMKQIEPEVYYFPTIDIQFIRHIMNTVSIKENTQGKPPISNNMTKIIDLFYESHYKKTVSGTLPLRDNIKHILNYEEIDIVKNITTNIKEHYASHLHFLIKIYFGFDKEANKIGNIKDKEERTQKYKELNQKRNQLVTDIVNVKDITIMSDKKYHKYIIEFRKRFIPQKDKFLKKSIYYDVKANPFDYLESMISMNQSIEKINEIIISKTPENKKPNTYRLFNALPLRTDTVYKYITLDTASLISIFPVTNKGQKLRKLSKTKTKYKIWNSYFNFKKRSFKRKEYKFNYMIKTDGVGSSVLFVQLDEIGNPIKEPTKKEREYTEKYNTPSYFNEVDKKLIKNKGIITGDIGMSDMLCLLKENKSKHKTSSKDDYIKVKYTRGQRDKDTKSKKYDRIRESKKTDEIQEIETELSNYNSKTCDLTEFIKYVKEKNKSNSELFGHYNDPIFRKLKFNTVINTRRSEDNFINKVKDKMGLPNKNIIILGDYSNPSMKGHKSVITSKWIKIFKRHGYQIYLIDEYKTSKLCCQCGEENEHFIERLHLKNKEKEEIKKKHEKKTGKKSLVWKLLRCFFCKAIHNRDTNACKNMIDIVKYHIKKNKIPSIFKRPEE